MASAIQLYAEDQDTNEQTSGSSALAKSQVRMWDADHGGTLLMRPLPLHASYPSDAPAHRRVIHLNFACEHLPFPLKGLPEPDSFIEMGASEHTGKSEMTTSVHTLSHREGRGNSGFTIKCIAGMKPCHASRLCASGGLKACFAAFSSCWIRGANAGSSSHLPLTVTSKVKLE